MLRGDTYSEMELYLNIAWYMHFYTSLNFNTVVSYGQVGRSPCTELLNPFL